MPGKGRESINKLLLGLGETEEQGGGVASGANTEGAGRPPPPGLRSLLSGGWGPSHCPSLGLRAYIQQERTQGLGYAPSIRGPHSGGEPRAEQALPPACPDMVPKAETLSTSRRGREMPAYSPQLLQPWVF